jgi:hypothetical protein
VPGLGIGDEIRLDAASFHRLFDAFFAEIEAKFSQLALAACFTRLLVFSMGR